MFLCVVFLIGISRKTFGTTDIQDKLLISPSRGCQWEKLDFPKNKISLYFQNCPNSPTKVFETKQGSIGLQISKNSTVDSAIEIFDKKVKETPDSILKKMFSKLNPEQQKICTTKEIITPLDQSNINQPYVVPHKIRYQIVPNEEWFKTNQGKNMSSTEEFPCGKGNSAIDARGNYYEFDDRSASRYIKINLLNNDEGPAIDLNTIRF